MSFLIVCWLRLSERLSVFDPFACLFKGLLTCHELLSILFERDNSTVYVTAFVYNFPAYQYNPRFCAALIFLCT
jgi:hypothetical protein